MKKILLLFFLSAILAGCGNNYTSGGNGISIRMKSGTQNSYHLLSVRDSSLVVMDASDDAKGSSFTHAVVIRFDSIDKIYHDTDKEAGQYVGGSAAGLALGFTVGIFLGQPAYETYFVYNTNGDERGTYQSRIRTQFIMTVVASSIVGILLGILVVSLLPSPHAELNPTQSEHLKYLRLISVYPNGEPELLKLVH